MRKQIWANYPKMNQNWSQALFKIDPTIDIDFRSQNSDPLVRNWTAVTPNIIKIMKVDEN